MYIVIAFAIAVSLWSALCIALDVTAHRWGVQTIRGLITYYFLGLAFYKPKPWYVRLHSQLHDMQHRPGWRNGGMGEYLHHKLHDRLIGRPR